ncbi:hypothetical protein BDV98DRAFT_406653 [Pterulicium gracile]|uniref:Uncharacterized protein n=1 Tax=Pterulicium gracile TaxID=1884261 RepID=A0A5C3QLS4_9AGAR|nr:hypothetical protein BDV98DRAFT_406653 [Pterula gracilis]
MRTITHLPTPSHSISPEPQQPRPSLKVETALSPTITFASLATGIGIAGPSSPRKSVEAVPPTPISANLDYGDMFMTRLSSLFSQDGAQGEDAMDIDNDEEQEANDRAAPTSPGTFDARFAEFEQRMEGFLRSVEEGELEEFGWSSDLVPLDSS